MNHRVLIVDDEPNIANTLEAILRSTGYEAQAAHSAEQALEMIAEWPPAFAIVDVVLPGLNGIEFGKLLRARYPECGLCLFSGETRTGELLDEAEREGHQFEVIAKPVHPNVFLEKIAAVSALSLDRPVELPLEPAGTSTPVGPHEGDNSSQVRTVNVNEPVATKVIV
jgi:DNA-binding response OmpR family regulator